MERKWKGKMEMDMNKQLFYAAYDGNFNECMSLIKKGADPNSKDSQGLTIAQWLLMSGKNNTVDFLTNLFGK